MPQRPDRPVSAAVEAALLTPPGRGALAVVGIRGPGATRIVAAHLLPRGPAVENWEPGRIGLGRWRGVAEGGPGAVAAEDVVAVRTDEGWEIHSHGGVAAPAAILEDLRRRGASLLAAERWPAGDPTRAEAAALFPAVRGPRAARILARQDAGALDAALRRIRASIAAGMPGDAERLAERLLAAGRVGLRLARPWRVVIAGAVNAGKSSLANALAGYPRAIVSPIPGTTRDAVETTIVLGGWEIVLVDTAGHETRGGRTPPPTELAGMRRAREQVAAADLVLHVVEAGGPPADGPGIAVWSKCDVAPGLAAPAGVVRTSAATGEGIDRLAAEVVDRVVPEERRSPGLLDGPVPFTERHLREIDALVARARKSQ